MRSSRVFLMLLGQPLAAGDMVYPCQVSFPMGFSCTTYFAQAVASRLFATAIPPTTSQPQTDICSSKVLSAQPCRAAHFTYIDNLGIIAASLDEVAEVLNRTQSVFNGRNLLLHEIDLVVGLASTSGCVLDVNSFRTFNSVSRFSRLHQSIAYILKQAVLAGCVLEVAIGHCTHFAPVNRDILGVFHCCYSFIAKSYRTRVPIWNSAHGELRAFIRAYGFCNVFLGNPRSEVMYAVGSSLKGYSVQSSVWDPKVVREIGLRKERSRWKLGAEKARERTLDSAGFLVREDEKLEKNEEGSYVRMDRELPNEIRSDRLELEPGLNEEIPNCLLEPRSWRRVEQRGVAPQ